MRKIIYITILNCLLLQTAIGQTAMRDTVFIWKDSIMGYSQSIFFETNKKSKFYDNVISFKFGAFDERSYQNSLKFLKENSLYLNKQTTVLPSSKWIILKQYKGKIYAYHPCDFYTFYKVSINDSTYIDWTGEGPVANKIIYQKRIDNNTYKLQTTGIYEQNRTITINIIDKKKGIAVVEEKTESNPTSYLLMIMADKIKTVPFIVNNCETHKQFELKFEKANFDKLLNRK